VYENSRKRRLSVWLHLHSPTAAGQHAAVEHTFVQFYPTLKPVAMNFGTYNEAREKVR
jgi:hypothetical protein